MKETYVQRSNRIHDDGGGGESAAVHTRGNLPRNIIVVIISCSLCVCFFFCTERQRNIINISEQKKHKLTHIHTKEFNTIAPFRSVPCSRQLNVLICFASKSNVMNIHIEID